MSVSRPAEADGQWVAVALRLRGAGVPLAVLETLAAALGRDRLPGDFALWLHRNGRGQIVGAHVDESRYHGAARQDGA